MFMLEAYYFRIFAGSEIKESPKFSVYFLHIPQNIKVFRRYGTDIDYSYEQIQILLDLPEMLKIRH